MGINPPPGVTYYAKCISKVRATAVLVGDDFTAVIQDYTGYYKEGKTYVFNGTPAPSGGDDPSSGSRQSGSSAPVLPGSTA